MKGLDQNEQRIQKQEIENVIQAEPKQEFRFIGSMRKVPGLKIWEADMEALEVREAEFETNKTVDITKLESVRDTVIVKKGCVYIQAMNKEVAMRKIIKDYHILLK